MNLIRDAIRMRRRGRAPVTTLAQADVATLARIEVELTAAVAFRALLSRRAEGHRACGDPLLGDLLTAQVSLLSNFIAALDAERFRLGGGID